MRGRRRRGDRRGGEEDIGGARMVRWAGVTEEIGILLLLPRWVRRAREILGKEGVSVGEAEGGEGVMVEDGEIEGEAVEEAGEMPIWPKAPASQSRRLRIQ